VILDAIEGSNQGIADLYTRRIVDCDIHAGNTVKAYAYFYSRDADLRPSQRVMTNTDGYCVWPASST
jgi:uncharacterized protein (DUF885 family)